MDNVIDTTKETKKVYKDITDSVKKLTSALYRVTDLMSDKEPLKWTLRNKAVVLYDNLASFSFVKDKNFVFNEMVDALHQIINVLELCSKGTSVSSLNFEILKREYSSLMAFIDGNKEDIVFGQKFLADPIFAVNRALAEKNKNTTVKKEKSEPFLISRQSAKTAVSISEKKGRKERILDFLKREGPKTISEIATIFNGEISHKTVQRDLVSLVKDGKLVAKGEKRWRSYFVNPAKK